MDHLLERRFHTDRRRPQQASDLHRRIEEKRQQIERRKMVRREADRDSTHSGDRSEATDRPATPPERPGEVQPAPGD